jgi:DNA polymerase-3 subunit alpha
VSQGEFVHLHNHSQYSLLDGACRIDDMLAATKDMGMPAVAITDHGNMFGAIEFYQKAQKFGINPIIGMETYVAPESRFKKGGQRGVSETGYHLVLLVKNESGYKNLIKLSSIGYQEGFYHKPRIDKEVLKQYCDGLIASSACLHGEIARFIQSDRFDDAELAAREYLDIFGKENYFLEVQNHGQFDEIKIAAAIKDLARKLDIHLLATNDCHYMKQEHSKAHDALLCIQTGKLLSDTDRMKYNTDQIYFKSPQEMIKLFADTPEAIENTLRIAEACNLTMDLYKNKVPRFPVPDGFDTLEAYLRQLCEEGLKRRYNEVTAALQERLDYELGVINRMGYAGYFLIVRDFIDYARSIGVRVGPGRGSAAGSIVSYCLGITSLDPIEYGLLFERFLNPERISMPDIDIDFADRGRDQVIEYVTKKYGRENVVQIITFGSMAARAVVRDVGRVMSLPYSEVDSIAKLIPMEIDMTLDKALEREPELKKRYQENEKIQELIEYSKVLEGLARHASTHAAGVVIAPGPVTDYAPLYKSNKDEITTQYDMHGVEAIGLLKMDFLGLRTLTVIDDCLKLQQDKGINPNIDNVPLDDLEIYKLFTRAETVGIFQFESSGMREYLKKLKPTMLEDLTVMNALYRPGPLDAKMIDVYIDCKHGRKAIECAHPLLEQILKETYGVIVFQEQVLKIAQELAGYTMGEADVLRKAMGKKQAEVMAKQKTIFIGRAAARGIGGKTAEKIFEQIETFGRYGFVKAHSACYAYIAYQTAFLKVHYPVEFMAALMTSEMSDTSRIVELRNECERLGLTLRPPDINRGVGNFSVDGNEIIFGLTAVKSVGQNAVESIVAARNSGGKFHDLFDLCSRVDLRLVNKRTIENLAMSGALDSFESTSSDAAKARRATIFAGIESAVAYGSGMQREKESGQSTLFGDISHASAVKPRLPAIPAWTETDVLVHEKESLGFWISGHPLGPFKDICECFSDMSLSDLEKAMDGKDVIVVGIITKLKLQASRQGKPFAILTLEDFTGTGEVILFSDVIEKRRLMLIEGNPVVVFGKTSAREGEKPKIKGNDLTLLEAAPREFPVILKITIEGNLNQELSQQIIRELSASPGNSEVHIDYGSNGKRLLFRATKFKADPTLKLLKTLKSLFGPDSVKLIRTQNRIA